MATAEVGSLRVSLGIDSAQFTDGLTKAQKNLQQVGNRMKAVGATIATVGAGIAVAFGSAFVKLGLDALQAADDIGDAAVRLGVTAEAFQKLEIAATSAGAAPGIMGEAMDKLNVGLGAFMQSGGGPAADAFKQLGLSGQIASGQIKTADQAFYAAAKALEGISSPAEKARLSMQLFGRAAGADMLEVLAPGADALIGYGEAAAQSGRVMSEGMIAKLADAKLTIDNTKLAFSQMAQVMVGETIVSAVAFVDSLGPMIAQGKALAAQIGDYLGPAFKEMSATISTLMSGPFGKALVATLKLLAEVVGTVVVVALRSLIEALNFVFGVLDKVARSVAGFVSTFTAGFQALANTVPGFIQKMVAGVTSWLTGKLFDVLNSVISKVKGVSDAFFNLYDAVVGNSYVPDMVEGIAAWMSKLDAGMVTPAKNATDATKATFDNLRADVATIMDRLLTDTERAARQLAQETATINAAVSAGQMTRGQGNRAIAGIAGEDLVNKPIPELGSLGTEGVDFAKSIKDGLTKSRQAFDDTAREFGDRFSYHMEGVLRGDIMGVFQDMISDMLRQSLSNLGTSLFKSFGNSSGGGLDWGKIGSSVVGMFGGKKLPGFATGGTFKVGGSAGLDKNVVAFRATKGEMVDIRRPGQGLSGGAMSVMVNPSPYFDVQVQRVSSPIAIQTGQAGAKAGSGMAQNEIAKRTAYRTR